ncbi:MAG: hypothetical protein ABSH56_01130 [Bryobacteraceae bacterium]
MLAITGASRGTGLIAFGLAANIPFVVMSSNPLAALLNWYPVTIYLGVAILCKVGGDMMLEDRWPFARAPGGERAVCGGCSPDRDRPETGDDPAAPAQRHVITLG